LDPTPKQGRSLFETGLLFQKRSRLSIERRPHFNGRITYLREIVRDGRRNKLKAEEIEDEEMRKYEGGKMRR